MLNTWTGSLKKAAALTGLLATVSIVSAQDVQRTRVHYEPTWTSLDQHQTPKWLIDAKFGLFIYTPGPTRDEWETHHKRHGHKPNVTPHILNHYPDRWKPLAWDQIDWNPEALAQLAVDAGAQYVVLSHSSFIVNAPSKYADVKGSAFMRMGPPGRDYVGDMAKAVRRRGLRFGLYTNYINPKHHPQWVESVKELIDRYQPATLWFDGDKLTFPAEELKSRDLLAYYYNHSKKQDEVAAEDAMGSYKVATWGKRLHHGDWYRKEESPPHDEISDGYYIRYRELFYGLNKSPVGESGGLTNNLIEWLVDCAAKGGGLEPAVFLGPPDHFDVARRCLLGMGGWLKVNGEAIYGTRPWHEGQPQDITARGTDVRYTTKGDALYATLCKWEPSGPTFPNLHGVKGSVITLLGGPHEPLRWEQTKQGLRVFRVLQDMTAGKRPDVPGDHAFVWKITPRPRWKPALK